MDRADQLIDQEEATRYSFIEHHIVNGRTSLFPKQEAQDDEEHTKVKLGEATYSRFKVSRACLECL